MFLPDSGGLVSLEARKTAFAMVLRDEDGESLHRIPCRAGRGDTVAMTDETWIREVMA
jgi:hypothetical protein